MNFNRPKLASTVVLCRPDGKGKFEVFMTRRPVQMRFMGGFYVFPGGGLREGDCSDKVLSRCRGLSPEKAKEILGGAMGPKLALAHWIAAIRELFEEVGILLCTGEDGADLDLGREGLGKRLAEKREALARGRLDFAEFLESERLFCAASRLVYFSHRITPEVSPIRFDTRFFLARAPADQSPLIRSEEVTDALWLAPGEALAHAQEGSLPIMPPTTSQLKTLAAIGSYDELFSRYRPA